MRILITGAKGQLGTELVRCLKTMESEIGSLPSEYRDAKFDAIDHIELDISNESAVELWFSTHIYDVVINCAAFTNVDGCEIDEEHAYRVNAIGPRNLARACATQDATFVQVSTDYVFSGNEPGDRAESDPLGPISAYGRTKLAGEQFAMIENAKTFIVRTAWLYGYSGANFVKTMRRLGAEREAITVVSDQFGNPTNANDLAHEILRITLTDAYGVYHVTNNGTCSWAEFAVAIMQGSQLCCKVIPISSEEYKAANPTSANRPHYSSLANRNLSRTIGDEMRQWRDALESYLSLLPNLEE